MNKLEIKQLIAKNINQLTDTNVIRDGKVTADDIDNMINYVYREVLFPRFASKYPADFEQVAVQPTYTTTGTIDAASSGTTLVTTTDTFTNDLVYTITGEGFEIENATDSEKIKVAGYTNATTVTMAANIDTWTGDTVYVLSNKIPFGGDAEDIFAIRRVDVKYASTDAKFTPAVYRPKSDLFKNDNEVFSTTRPFFDQTTVYEDGTYYSAIELFPYPTSYTGIIRVLYIKKPVLLNDADTPRLDIPGIGLVIVNGVTAWALRLKHEPDVAATYEEMDPKTREVLPRGTLALELHYHPKSTGTVGRIRPGGKTLLIKRRGA